MRWLLILGAGNEIAQEEVEAALGALDVGMERTHLYRKLKSLEIEFKDKR